MNQTANMNSITEALKNNPISPNKITPLDFKNTHKLPDSHKWTGPSLSGADSGPVPVDQPESTHEVALPVVDLGLHPHAHAQGLTIIREASEKWGAFQVINHGVPANLLEEMERQTKRLFALPTDQKLLVVRSPGDTTGYGLAHISQFYDKQMWHEGFTIMGSPKQHAAKLWPEDHADFCYVMEEYENAMKELTERIIGLMLESLGFSPEDAKWFEPKSENKPSQCLLQLNSYPVCPDPSRAMGLAPHTDTSLITIVYPSNTTGLQVHQESAGWVTVHPINGALVVNIGDLMHIATNGRFKSVLHRVIVNNTHHRISAAYFYGPTQDVKLSPSMKLIDSDHPLLYNPITWKEYLDAKAKHFHQALEVIRKAGCVTGRLNVLN